jgi:hypothetical protein
MNKHVGPAAANSLPVRVGVVILAMLFNGYTRVFRKGGHHGAPHHRRRRHGSTPPALKSHDLAELDGIATRLGAAYRGCGVMMGALAALVTLLALLPVLVPMPADAIVVLGAVELGLMACVLILGAVIRRSHLKRRWIMTRNAAEWMRYQHLRSALSEHQARQTRSTSEALHSAVHSLIDGGGHCQLRYHLKRLSDHEEIEAFGMTLTYVSFASALVAAVLHLFLHANWLLLFTVYLPTLVGVMHAVNGFLRLPQLVAYHGEMVEFLQGIHARLQGAPDAVLLECAKAMLERLEAGDRQWSVIAREQTLHPL